MRKIILCMSAVIGIALWSGSAGAATLRVIVVQSTDLKAYLHEVGTLRAQFKKIGLPVTLRAWRARFAGSEAGAIVVSVEVPDLATLAKVDDAQKGNSEIAATMQRIEGLRKIASDSIYEELSP